MIAFMHRNVGPALTALVFLSLIQITYQYTFPVAAFMRVTSVQAEKESVTMHLEGWKLRKCTYIKGTANGLVLHDGIWSETPFAYVRDVSPGSTKPTGLNDFGLHRWSLVEFPNSTKTQVCVKHQCGTSIVDSCFGPFDIK